MATKCFIEDRNSIPDFARITGANIIDLEFEFDKAKILERRCEFELELTDEQIEELNRAAVSDRFEERYYSKLRENAALLHSYPPRTPVTEPELPKRSYR